MLAVYNIGGRINIKYWLSYLSLIWLCHSLKASYVSSPSKQMLPLLVLWEIWSKHTWNIWTSCLSTTYLCLHSLFLLPFSSFVEQNRLFFLRLKANTLLCTLDPYLLLSPRGPAPSISVSVFHLQPALFTSSFSSVCIHAYTDFSSVYFWLISSQLLILLLKSQCKII